MNMLSGGRTRHYTYKMVTAVCLIASACAIAVVNAVMAARVIREE
jgi:hypothetical protein